MMKIHFFQVLPILFAGIHSAIAQDHTDVAPCDPNQYTFSQCTPDPCDPNGTQGSLFSSSPLPSGPFTFSGWVEAGVYVNADGSNNNGPFFAASHQRTDFLMNQLYFIGEKTMDIQRGFDWGARADLVYGVDGPSMQCADGTFDFDWGTNRHGYGMAAYQLYGTLGYNDLSVKIGKFITPIGWEGTASKDNFFYSHSYCYWIEPGTHTGVLATYKMTDRLTANAGWVTGENASFQNPYDSNAVLAGFTYTLADNASLSYWFNGGSRENETVDYFFQSLCLQWALTDRFTYVFQYDLRNENFQDGQRISVYGINNHFLYKLTDQLSVGTRLEWLRNNNFSGIESGDYWEMTFGFNWNPYENVSIRPDVRYDWCRGGARPYADGRRNDQVSSGFGILVSF